MSKSKLPGDGTANTKGASSGVVNRMSLFTDLANFCIALGALFNHPTLVEDRNATDSQASSTGVALLGSVNNDSLQ